MCVKDGYIHLTITYIFQFISVERSNKQTCSQGIEANDKESVFKFQPGELLQEKDQVDNIYCSWYISAFDSESQIALQVRNT